VLSALHGVQMVGVRHMNVVGGCFVIPFIVMPGGFVVMACSVLVMFRCLGVMLGCLL
jgi:hypothetical protein